jgi:DNA-binding protein YbaB
MGAVGKLDINDHSSYTPTTYLLLTTIKNMFNKIKQIKDMRSQAKTMQAALAEVMVVGKAMSGKVMITVDGNQKVQGVKIDTELEREKIEKGVQEAFNDASKKLQSEMAAKMKDMGGLDALKDLM